MIFECRDVPEESLISRHVHDIANVGVTGSALGILLCFMDFVQRFTSN